MLDRNQFIETEKHPRGWTTTNLVFPSFTGTPLFQRNVARSWAIVKAKTGVAEYGLHSLRHTTASIRLLVGVGMREISANLGHTDPGFTSRTYAHTLKETRRLTAQKMEAFFEAEEERRGKASSTEDPA